MEVLCAAWIAREALGCPITLLLLTRLSLSCNTWAMAGMRSGSMSKCSMISSDMHTGSLHMQDLAGAES